MRSVVLGLCFVLFSPFLWGGDAVKDFTQEMPKSQKHLFTEFLSAIVDSSAGYVLYGDKPMSIETYDLSSLRTLSNPNPRILMLVKGKELWEDLNLPNNKEYLLLIFEKDSNCHVVCIGRKAFLQNVKENIALFRYVLGPAVTAEGLLNELAASKNQFYEVLKNDRVLLEILLGNGKQNAIVHARLADLTDPCGYGNNEEFPLISKKLCKAWAASSEKYRTSPSFSFQSITDEEFALKRLAVDSGKLKPFDSCPLPRFECEPDSEETKALLGSYEHSRSKIVKALRSKNFLEEALRKFFTANSQTAEIPRIPKQRDLCLPSSKEEIARKLVQIIQKRIAVEPYGTEKFQAAFLEGIAAREKGKKMPVPFQMKRSNDLRAIERDVECCKNLGRANAYFSRLAARDDLVALIPNEIFYKVLKSGKGDAASSKLKKVSLQYSFQILGDSQSKDWGIVKQEKLGALIPGIAYALIGMQKGEERVVYIHPKHAYGEETFFAPNISIVAQIRLLDFEEGDQSIAIFPPHQLEVREYKDLLAKFEVLRGEEFFDEGVEFWDSIKKSGDYLDFQTFQKVYGAYSKDPASPSVDQDDQFVVDLEYHLLSLQKRD